MHITYSKPYYRAQILSQFFFNFVDVYINTRMCVCVFLFVSVYIAYLTTTFLP